MDCSSGFLDKKQKLVVFSHQPLFKTAVVRSLEMLPEHLQIFVDDMANLTAEQQQQRRGVLLEYADAFIVVMMVC